MSGFLDQLRALVGEMSVAAARRPPDLTPPPAFDLEVSGASARLRITTDNGGGPETSHPIEDVVRLSWDEAGVTLSLASGVFPPAMALALVRQRCVRELPAGALDAPPDEAFECAFCGVIATVAIDPGILRAARRCPCGALGLCNPGIDDDETIDDALRRFAVELDGIAHQQRVEALEAAGVAVRTGWEGELPGMGAWSRHLTLWFRR